MIRDVDLTLAALVRERVGDVPVGFEAPTKEWAAKQPRPGINLYLYDVREDLKRREAGRVERRDDGVVTRRRRPARHFRLSYLVTAWTQPPVDEHNLLSDVLLCFLGHEILPPDHLVGGLQQLERPVPMCIALPPTEDRSFADVWSALGGELRPSLDVVVVVPVDAAPDDELKRTPDAVEMRLHDRDDEAVARARRRSARQPTPEPLSRHVRRWPRTDPPARPETELEDQERQNGR